MAVDHHHHHHQDILPPPPEKDDKDKDNKDKSKSKSSTSKSKDLSHVPCKFFRVGSCTAGSSCPFSHQSPSSSSGGQKDVCAWFVKGNCKFGHKCALAHILPGQGMAMDRKNKKAAQLSAAAAGQTNTSITTSTPSAIHRSKGNRINKDHTSSSTGPTPTPGTTASGPSPGPSPSSATTTTPSAPSARNPLLSGSTAPTRSVHPTPPRMPNLKATISPSAPAPPLKDTDFANFGLDADDGKLPSAPALPQASPVTRNSNLGESDENQNQNQNENGNENKKEQQESDDQIGGALVDKSKEKPVVEPTTPLPLHTPSAARRTHISSRPSHDFGPIGSPPRSSPHITTLNGFSPSASPPPAAGFGITSPFSAPGNTFAATLSPPNNNTSTSTSTEFKTRSSGIAASLGAARGGWSTDFGPVPSQVLSASVTNANALGRERDIVVEDEDLEEFVPGSLSELLSPSERSRRMSRTYSGQQQQQQRPIPTGSGSGSGISIGSSSILNDGTRHHYSRSVPAPSLLGDIASIWADASPLPSSSGLGLGIGTPSSFKSSSNTFGGGSLDLGGGEPSPSTSLLSPSNASAAFLPGLHHYLGRPGMGSGVQRSVSGGDSNTSHNGSNRVSGLHAHSNFSGGHAFGTTSSNNGNGNSTAFSPPRLNAFGSRPPFSTHHDSHSNSHLLLPSSSSSSSQLQDTSYYSLTANRAQPIPADSHNLYSNPQAAISPSARALQAHAPGQSLPQGLAAGYSRIHALPPLPNLPSPALSGVGSPGTGTVSGSPGATAGTNHNNNTNNHAEWSGLGKTPEQSQHPAAPPSGNSSASTGLFSRLSYSAVATSSSSRTSSQQHSNFSMTSSGAAPTMRNSSGGKNWHSGTGGPLSPLSGPVVTGDDDDLFSMDG